MKVITFHIALYTVSWYFYFQLQFISVGVKRGNKLQLSWGICKVVCKVYDTMILRHCLYQHCILWTTFFFSRHKYLTLTASYSPHSTASSETTHFDRNRKFQIYCSHLPPIRAQALRHSLCCATGRKQSTCSPLWGYHEISSAYCCCCPPQYVSNPYSYTCNTGWPTNVPFIGVIQATPLEEGSMSSVQFGSTVFVNLSWK